MADNLARKPSGQGKYHPTDTKKYQREGNIIRPQAFSQRDTSDLSRQKMTRNSGAKPDVSHDNLRQVENSSWQRPDDIEKSENSSSDKINYTNSQPDSSGKGSKTDSKKPWFRQNKNKVIGTALGIAMFAGLFAGGGILSLPAQFLQVAELIKNVTDTVHEGVLAIRGARNAARASRLSRSVATALQESRLGVVSRYWVRSYEKKLLKAGVEIVSDDVGRFVGYMFDPKKIDAVSVMKNLEDVATKQELKEGKLFVKIAEDGMPNSEIVKTFRKMTNSILRLTGAARAGPTAAAVTRTIAKKNLMTKFHYFEKFKAKKLSSLFEKMSKYLAKKEVRKFAQTATEITLEQAEKKIAKKLSTKILKSVISGAVNVLFDTNPVGLVINLVDSAATLYLKRAGYAALISMTLGVSMAKTTDLMTMADQIKEGYLVEESSGSSETAGKDILGQILSGVGIMGTNAYAADDEEGEEEVDLDLWDQLELETSHNFFSERDAVDIEKNEYEKLSSDTADLPADTSNAEKENVSCSSDDENCRSYDDAKSNNNTKKNDAYKNVDKTGISAGKVSNSFWECPLIDSEIEGSWSGSKAHIPMQLLAISEDQFNQPEQWAKDIANSLIEGFGPGVSPDTFDDEQNFDDTGLTASQIGCETAYGMQVTKKEKMRAIGGTKKTKEEARIIEQERREFVAMQYNQKPLTDKLFDPNDYRSALATLAREAKWEPANGTIDAQLRNIAKTVANAPRLLAKAFRPTAFAADAEAQFDYGIGELGYSDNDLDELPDFDQAVLAVEEKLEQGEIELKKSGLVIKQDGRVEAIGNEDSFEKENGNYNYQDTDTGNDDGYDNVVSLTSSLPCSKCEESTVPNAVRAYILDYQLMTADSIMMDDDATESEETFAELEAETDGVITKESVESRLRDAYKDLIATESSTSSAGVVDDSDSGADSGSVGSIVGGTAQELAKQILENKNITFTGGDFDSKMELQQVANGGNLYYCDNSQKGGPAANPDMLGLVLAASEKYKIQIGVISGKHGCDSGNHPKGKAIDINGITLGSQSTSFHYENASDKSFIASFAKYLDSIAQNSNVKIGIGQSTCGAFSADDFSIAQTFEDSCNHLHVDIRQ